MVQSFLLYRYLLGYQAVLAFQEFPLCLVVLADREHLEVQPNRPVLVHLLVLVGQEDRQYLVHHHCHLYPKELLKTHQNLVAIPLTGTPGLPGIPVGPVSPGSPTGPSGPGFPVTPGGPESPYITHIKQLVGHCTMLTGCPGAPGGP